MTANAPTADRVSGRAPRFRVAGIHATIIHALQSERGRRLPWIATAYGAGVGIYFALRVEPSGLVAASLAILAMVLWGCAWRGRHGMGLIPLILGTLVAGILVGQIRAASTAGPVLGFRYYGPVEGRVVTVDRSASGRVRITLADVRLDRVSPARTPRRVRLSLHADAPVLAPKPGMRVMTTAHLTPPAGPTEPGAFDFQRHAWFLSLGAMGYSRVPLLRAEEDATGGTVARMRMNIAETLRDRMPGPAGAVAAAIAVGDRSGLPDDVTATLRDANLAHLLAISGLHMGLVAGFVYWSVRAALAAVPALAVRRPIHVWAAAVALPAAAAYLILSGGSVATQRAFVMAAIALGAVMAGRHAVSLRALALAALVVLTLRPESLVGPGFQMSFAATGALVLVFGALRDRGLTWGGWRGAIVALVLSSLVAGLATAPFAAAHFNRMPQYGLLANLAAVPVMGMIVMPSLVLTAVLWPVGAEALPLLAAGYGIEWILAVAGWVASLDGAVRGIPAPPGAVLPLLGTGMALFACMRGGGRIVAAAPLAVAAAVWTSAERPLVLVSERGGMVGVLGPEGRWLSRARGEGFVAGAWLAHDADPSSQDWAAGRLRPRDGTTEIVVARGIREMRQAVAACSPGSWLVTDQSWDGPRPRGCVLLDADAMRRTGAIAVLHDGTILAARDIQGARPWTGTRLWSDQLRRSSFRRLQ